MEKIEQIKAEIKRKYKSYEKILKKNINPFLSFSLVSRIEECKSVLSFIDSLEEPVSNDLEEFAKRESELFGEREYEIDFIDRNALTKGYYWGVKAGAQWQKKQDQLTIELAEDHAYLAGQEKIIEKACKWLNNFYSEDRHCYFVEEDIDNFKKAMEE